MGRIMSLGGVYETRGDSPRNPGGDSLCDREVGMRHVDIEVVCLLSRDNTKTGYFEARFYLAKRSNEFARWVSGLPTMRGVRA